MESAAGDRPLQTPLAGQGEGAGLLRDHDTKATVEALGEA
jgi:hypothetical protein